MKFSQSDIIAAIANEASRRTGRAGDWEVTLIVHQKGDNVTVEAKVTEK